MISVLGLDMSEELVAINNQSPLLKQDITRAFVFSLLDITTLEATDSPTSVGTLSANLVKISKETGGEVSPAAICVYPVLAPWVSMNLVDTSIKLATVANFPHGQSSSIPDIELGLRGGSQEFDPVFPFARFRDPLVEDDSIIEEMLQLKEAAKGFPIKMIMQVGRYNLELDSEISKLRYACRLAISCGADFLKTSTGKDGDVATIGSVTIVAEIIREHFLQTGKIVGLKISGGVRTFDQAVEYLLLVDRILGKSWIRPDRLRFGASSLAKEILNDLKLEV